MISKKISIIIALYNEEKTIREILNRIKKTKKNFRFIIGLTFIYIKDS